MPDAKGETSEGAWTGARRGGCRLRCSRQAGPSATTLASARTAPPVSRHGLWPSIEHSSAPDDLKKIKPLQSRLVDLGRKNNYSISSWFLIYQAIVRLQKEMKAPAGVLKVSACILPCMARILSYDWL